MSRKFNGRDVNGILLLDKPPGMTSNEALQAVKRTYQARKAGHTGSLDPIASGLLPICFGSATRFSQYLLEADKTYRVVMKLGIKTTTGDSEGEIVSKKLVGEYTADELSRVLEKFNGEISQVPSMYSAIKYQGQPLYKLARQGITVERQPRKVTIYSLQLINYAKELIELEVICSKGTYIRTLVEDIGDELGCCAHVVALRRLAAGNFHEKQMVTMHHIEDLLAKEGQMAIDSLLLSVESVVANWPEVTLSDAALFYVRQGQAVIVPYAPSKGWVRLKLKDGRFIGIGEILADGKVAPRKMI